jgi:hypothetical protein
VVVVGFDRVEHLVRVPVRLGGEEYRFLVDTGIGVTVVSSAIAARADVQATGETLSGRRMSGQVIATPLVRLPGLALGDHTVDEHVAGVADLGEGFDGILGLGFFEQHTLTTDPIAMSLTIQPRESFQRGGHAVPLEVRRDGVSVVTFVRLVLPSGQEICVEVDTGSHSLILDTRFMSDCGVQRGDPGVTTKSGTDETGYEWTRHWVSIPGSVHLAAAPETAQPAPRVQFQDIIHDGLIGASYLERYLTTFDVSGERLILGDL